MSGQLNQPGVYGGLERRLLHPGENRTQLSAMDDSGKPVDWWFMYKAARKCTPLLPRMLGTQYPCIDSATPPATAEDGVLSPNRVNQNRRAAEYAEAVVRPGRRSTQHSYGPRTTTPVHKVTKKCSAWCGRFAQAGRRPRIILRGGLRLLRSRRVAGLVRKQRCGLCIRLCTEQALAADYRPRDAGSQTRAPAHKKTCASVL